MSKPVHLTDMLLRRTEGPSAERQAKAASPASFQERIKESQARLAGKNHSFFKKPGQQARAEAHEGPSVREPRPNRDNPSRPESADPASKPDAREDKIQGECISET
ncbi:MAG TPA: hypothetical protein VK465_13370, partial [Fibrobacteria bacterium]|nr:hypothetical protein [Fibrobacteria bacterium]